MHGHAGGDFPAGAPVVAAVVAPFGLAFQKRLERVRAHAQRLTLDIHEYRAGAGVDNGVGGGHESQRLGNHLVARLDACDPQGDLQRGGAVDHCHRMPGAGELGHPRLELIDALADRGHEAGVDTLGQQRLLVAGEERAVQGDEFVGSVQAADMLDHGLAQFVG